MTVPKVPTIKRGDSRFYVHPDTAEKVPGVTSVVGMLPKPFLTRWAAKSVAEWTADNLGPVVSLMLKDPKGAVDLMKGAPWRDTRQAADTGTEVHDLFERKAKGEDIGRVHPDLKPYVDHFDAFLQEFSPEYVLMEETVWSDAHLYAGSFDALAKIEGEPVWIDYKTTRSGVHEEVALQLAAYSRAEYVLRGDGTRVPLPKADQAACLHVRPEGWGLYPVRIGDDVFDHFLHLRETFRWEKDVKDSVIGRPMNANPTKAKKRTTARSR